MSNLKIIIRSGLLTIKQVEKIMMHLPKVDYEILRIQNPDEIQREISQFANNPAAVFTDETEAADLLGEGVIAIYPASELPYPLPSGLEIIALTAIPEQSNCPIDSGNRTFSDLSVQTISSSGSNPLQGYFAVITGKDNVLLKELFSPVDCRNNYGKVYITGFGPGDPELLTVKALHALQQADIIFYDCLLNKAYLENFKGEKISSGKRKDLHLKEQDEINEMLYKAAISGKKVVRIKGGDPLIFGRGGEEYCYLKKRLIDVEIIPGITSALAAAAIAGIPLTQRNVSSSVAFCTGHPENKIHIPDTDTIVFYMSASNLNIILTKLIAAGRPTNTPVAIIENISLPKEKIITGTLNEFLLTTNTFHAPMLIIVGDVVKLNYAINEV